MPTQLTRVVTIMTLTMGRLNLIMTVILIPKYLNLGEHEVNMRLNS